MAKSIWKGDISFGLVSIPVSMVSTEEKNELHFHLLNPKTKARIRYQRVDETSGEVVPWNDIVKGYEYDKDSYIVINDEAFEKASPELFKTIDIEEFVNLKEIDSLYYTKPYFLLPEGKNKKSYVLLREALKKTNKVGVAKALLRAKEYLSLILPYKNALLLYLVHFKDEIRSTATLDLPDDTLKAYKISDKEIKIATDLINKMSKPWKPEKYKDDYREALVQWIENEIKKKKRSPKKSKKSISKLSTKKESVVDFIALLKESMKKTKVRRKKAS